MSRAAAEVGSTANSYQILAKLASGGMAEIFLARGEGVAGVERYCVLKRILRERATDAHFVQMFLDEARLAAQLQHANIAQVYDIGKLGDSYFFTMEYVHGETVRGLLGRAQALRRPLPLSCVLTIAAGTAAGLQYAHTRLGRDGKALGIVHRDVSPSNLMVGYDGGVKLVDFGVAKARDRSQETKSGTVKGKISYLSPEQCRGRGVDRRSDLFSLGICVWEMLTTERLYKRATDFENMNAIVTEATPPPSSRRPELPAEVDALVMRLLAKAADERFSTAEEVIEALEEVAQRCSATISTPALGRFMRDLFGQRPEPWHELDSQQELGEAVTVTSEPISHELAASEEHGVDRQLASVADLSPARQITESIDVVALPPRSDGVDGRRTPAGSAAEWQRGSIDVTARLGKRPGLGFPLAAPPPTDPGIAGLRGTRDVVRLPPPPAALGRRAGAVAAGDDGTQSLPSIELVAMTSSGEHPVLTVVPSGPAVSGVIPTSVPLAASATSLVATASALRRRSWLMYAVIGSAVVIAAISIVLIASGQTDRRDEATARVAIEPAPHTAGMTVDPIIEPAAPAVAAAAEPVATVTVAHKTGLSPQPAAPTAAPARPSDADVPQRYRDGQYAQVVELCSAGHPTAERAPLCFLAACHTSNLARARSLLAAVPAAKRDQLIANCKQLGVDVAPVAATHTPATDDCAADPMACQH